MQLERSKEKKARIRNLVQRAMVHKALVSTTSHG